MPELQIRWLKMTGSISRLIRRIKYVLRDEDTELKAGFVEADNCEGERDAELENQIVSLEKSVHEWEQLAGELERELDKEIRKVKELKETNDRLVAENISVKHSLSQSFAGGEITGTEEIVAALEEIPRDLNGLLDLAEALWPERIFVTEKARKGAGDYNGSVRESWEVLKCIATDLWQLKFDGGVGKRMEKAFAEKTGLELAWNENKQTSDNEQLMRLRRVLVDGKEYDCTVHVKGRNNRNALRVYLDFDMDNKRIILGHCGKHLTTSGSSRKGF